MATELLAVGTTALASSDFTVAANTDKDIFLKSGASQGIPANARVRLERKDSGGFYTPVDFLDDSKTAFTIDASSEDLTYRLFREACLGGGVGADSSP